MSASLVGSEMCIRDRGFSGPNPGGGSSAGASTHRPERAALAAPRSGEGGCLLYTSDAADDM
eukprot:14473768-Alexandrium_andersonii.AAC.1